MKTRTEAMALLDEWVTSENLKKHMFCVEAAMRAYAKKYNEDLELWGMCGLLHDFDYERFPHYDSVAQTGHPFEGVKLLAQQGYPESITEAILGHAIYSGVERKTLMAKVLFACDELCGFIVACAYLKPDKFEGVRVESVQKKLKDKSFAAKVSREDIDLGVQELGIEKSEHIQFVIDALKPIQDQFFN